MIIKYFNHRLYGLTMAVLESKVIYSNQVLKRGPTVQILVTVWITSLLLLFTSWLPKDKSMFIHSFIHSFILFFIKKLTNATY